MENKQKNPPEVRGKKGTCHFRTRDIKGAGKKVIKLMKNRRSAAAKSQAASLQKCSVSTGRKKKPLPRIIR